MSSLEEIHKKLNAYKKKFYRRQIIIGSLVFLSLMVVLYLFIGIVEHTLWLSSTARTVLFFSSIILALIALYALIVSPFLKLLNAGHALDDEQASADIAKFFPEIEDKLLNLLQLGKQNANQNALISAAIEKKAIAFKQFSFVQAVDFTKAKKYAFYFAGVMSLFFLVSFINPDIVSESPKRIVNYSQEFEREAPFRFEVLNDKLEAFRGEDFTLVFSIAGDIQPTDIKLLIGEKRRLQVQPDQNGTFSHVFERLQTETTFQIEANGFLSRKYDINLYDRPDLLSMTISIQNPNYTGGERRVITNTGDVTVLEGSKVKWQIEALSTKSTHLLYNEDTLAVNRVNQNQFEIEQRIFEKGGYTIQLENDFSMNKSKLRYSIDVIKDQYPAISAEFFPDSSTFQFVTLAGTISDDYGFSGLFLNYKKDNQKDFIKIPLEINANSLTQSFYANWNIDSLKLEAGTRLELFLSVGDNDQVNGVKTSKSKTFVFQVPSSQAIDEMLTKKSEGVENQLDNAQKEAESISEQLSEIEDRLKSQQKFDWQEKKMLENIIKDREELTKQIEELQKKHEDLQKSSNQFQKQSLSVQEKSKKMQELLDQLMDEETRKLYEKLKELLKENGTQDQVSQQLQQLQRNEQNLERDLERALELFKRLKMESALEQNLQKLDSLSSKQEQAAKQNTEETDLSESMDQQSDIKEQFDEFREKMDQVMELNQELKRPEALDDFEYEERQISKELREIMEEMEEMQNGEQGSESSEENGENEQGDQQGQKSKRQQQRQQSQQKQQNAAQKMKSLSQKLSNMQGGMQMEMMQANLDQLRDILDNLVKLSFNQEEIMTEMREVNQSDPRFLTLSQDQLKLKDDVRVIQDSLLSLASRVVQISSFVTREVSKINESIDETLEFLKDRNRGRALGSQQFAMTSINNLALLLDDTMQQMQMAMSEAMGNNSGQQQQSKGLPDLQQMQDQLGDKLEELQGSGKQGRQLSEELARLAAEQEMIRRQLEMLKEMQDGKPGGGLGGDNLEKAIQMMEQTEIDLVNKRLTRQLIYRQKSIQTRLLEAEKAEREQETEEEREASKPSIISREIPPEFEEYLKLKKKEVELLKTIPIELNPFYKKEVNDYFRRLSSEDTE
ncbi:MAG: hypothetical protein Tsb0034_14590 [Ekhidna sp.]